MNCPTKRGLGNALPSGGATRSSCLPTRDSRLPTAPAFTLVELLIVLAIISLIVALGIPLFGVLTGAKSVEAGRNVVAAALGQARTIAVNEGKYAGVMFYVDPASERTAMSIVISGSDLDDPDPYEKYKTWIGAQKYDAAATDPTSNASTRSDHVISMTADADATYAGTLYGQTPVVSNYLNYFGNYRPAVRVFRCAESNDSQDIRGNRPPRNGPYGSFNGSATPPPQYIRVPTASQNAAPGPPESENGAFANDNWSDASRKFTALERQLLPVGIGVQVIVQPMLRNSTPNVGAPSAPFRERYLRTAVILFDPQGRLVTPPFSIANKDPFGQSLGLDPAPSNFTSFVTGVGLVLYDQQAFRNFVTPSANKTSEADWLYQKVSTGTGNPYFIDSKYDGIFRDFSNPANPSAQGEYEEEQWLDNNTTPLLINRYSGSMSEAD